MSKTDIGIVFGKKAKHTGFGLLGCSRSMYEGGYDFYVYGIKGLFNFIVDKRWGNYAFGKRRF